MAFENLYGPKTIINIILSYYFYVNLIKCSLVRFDVKNHINNLSIVQLIY